MKNALNEETIKFKRPKMSWSDRKNEAFFLSPSFFGVLIFFVLPFFVIIYYSVVDSPVTGAFVGLENYNDLLSNSAFLQAAKNTATFSLMAVPLAVVLSLVMAMILEQNIPMKSYFRTFF